MCTFLYMLFYYSFFKLPSITYLKAFTATTTGTPKCFAFSICFLMLLQPFSSRLKFYIEVHKHIQ